MSADQAIRDLLKTYEQSLNTSDAALAKACYTRDGMFMATTLPTTTGADLEASYTAIFQTICLNVVFTIDELVVASDTVAYALTRSNGTRTIRATGTEGAESNREIFIFTVENGTWKIARYMGFFACPLETVHWALSRAEMGGQETDVWSRSSAENSSPRAAAGLRREFSPARPPGLGGGHGALCLVDAAAHEPCGGSPVQGDKGESPGESPVLVARQRFRSRAFVGGEQASRLEQCAALCEGQAGRDIVQPLPDPRKIQVEGGP